MAFITKCLIFSVFAATAYSRSLLLENSSIEIPPDNNCSCDWRYYKHYETKDCTSVGMDSCGCPQKFSCPNNQTQQVPAKVCVYKNKDYKVGSKIITSDFCQVCRCRDGVPPYISCVTRECPEVEEKSGQECHLVYRENSCCPVDIQCLKNETGDTTNKTCEYDGKYYPYGSKIYPVDDPCQTCVCDENWSGIDNASCYQKDCILEKSKSKLTAGCIPVYHERQCCPIEFYCPASHNLSYSVLSSNESFDAYNISNDDQCLFAGQSYVVGDELLIGNPCVKCNCVVPPDFTCVHQTCASSPNEKNCYPVYTDGECCPSYECMLGDTENLSDGCPTPLCADSTCRIETPPGHECPTCVCGERFSELEHNNLEQQVQQISQNIEQSENVQEVFRPRDEDDSSEDALQIMPIRMQEPGSQASVMEKMILLDPELSEAAEELDKSSAEDNSSAEAVNIESDEIQIAQENATAFLTELLWNNSNEEFNVNQSEKALQKRSDVSDEVNRRQSQVRVLFQHNIKGVNRDIEREGGESDASNGEFDDELESFKNRVLDSNRTIINEIISINHLVEVPEGCPTPMCEGPWCTIGMPPGWKCPTCICKSHVHSEP